MKKIVSVVCVLMVICLLAGCGSTIHGNKRYRAADFDWYYNIAYIDFGDHVERVEVDYWNEDDTTFTVRSKDGRVFCSSQNNIVLSNEPSSNK